MSRNFMRERLERRIVEINYIITDRLLDALENVLNWTTEEFNNNEDLIKSLENERQELEETLQKLQTKTRGFTVSFLFQPSTRNLQALI